MSGISISVDSGTTFESGAAQYIAVAKLDANTFVVAYQDNDDSNKGKAIVGTRIGTTISLGSIYEFETDEVSGIDICALSSSLIIISYGNDTDNKPYIIAATISGTILTFGSPVLMAGNLRQDASPTTVCKLDSTNFFCAYERSNYYVNGIIGSVSGTTISVGAESLILAAGGATYINCDQLNSTDVILTTGRIATNTYTYVIICNTGTQTFTKGAAAILTTVPTDAVVSAFDELHFVVFYRTATDNYIQAGSINDSTHVITLGTQVSDTTNITDIAICAMDSTHFLVSYEDGDDTNNGKVRAGSLTGSTTLAWDDEGAITFDTAIITYTGVCNLDGEYFLVGFKHT